MPPPAAPVTAAHEPDRAGTRAMPVSALSAATAEIVPGRIVVKYRDAGACPGCAAASVVGAAPPASPTLEGLSRKLAVRGARPLFRRDASAGRTARTGTGARARLDEVARRFPRRTARGRGIDAVPDLDAIWVLEIASDLDPRAAAEEYAADPGVEWAEPDRLVSVGLTTDDPYLSTSGAWGQSFADLWGLHAIHAPAAWDTATGGGVVVAVIDTGVDPGHPDIAANMWTNPLEIPGNGLDDDGNGYVDDVAGWDFAEDDANPLDRHGHGTHVAGTIAATGNNAQGIVGVAWNARIMAVKGLADSGYGATSDLAAAILYAAENGADVINNSWGGFGVASSLFAAVDAADALGTVVVSAAGNSGSPIADYLWMPAGHPRGLTVGAMTPFLSLASFSNRGPLMSIVAPGTDVLSLRSATEVFDASANVGQRYLRLSGTSMASPHAAGAAAVLLEATPTSTTAEVRWHLELNAEQPGAPGYEGERFNPTFGYGRLDLASSFAAPPVTTRLQPPRIAEWHAFAGSVAPIPGNPGSASFTSTAPVAWSLATPPWAIAAAPAGSGSAALDLSLDTTALGVGAHPGAIALSAPTAVDGGASFPARLHVHADPREGSRVVLGSDGSGGFIGFAPAVASNGISTAVAWHSRWYPTFLEYAMVDGAAASQGPVAASDHSAIDNVALATDGHDYLLAWRDYTGGDESVRFARIGADGGLMDSGKAIAVTRKDKLCTAYDVAGVGFDGDSYWIGLVERKYCRATSEILVVRVRRDGSFGKKVRVAKLATTAYAKFACRSGGCLFAWLALEPEGVDPGTGKYLRGGWALPVVGAAAAGPPRRAVGDLWVFTSLASDGTDYLALGQRLHLCGAGVLCRSEVIVVPIAADGAPLAASATIVSNVAPAELVFPWPGGVAWHGDGWVATMGMLAVDDSPFEDGSYVFATRLDPAGTPLSSEFVGDLVDDGGRASESLVAATATHSLVVWEDGGSEPLMDAPAFPHPEFRDHVAQRVYAEDADAAQYPERAIGAIGALSVAEGGRLSFRVTAPGLAPSAVFAASGLPAGAVFDPATQLFQWRPSATQAGAYPGIELTADDGTGVASEAISIAVLPALGSISGRVRLADGTAVANALVEIRGTTDGSRWVLTNADGRFAFAGGLSPGRRATIRLGQASRKLYKASPSSLRLVQAGGDVVAPDLVATPR